MERRSFGKVDRTWSQSEFDKLLEICRKSNHFDYLGCLKMARHAGLRIHECMRIDTATARNALKSGLITIRGKGGKVRQVPLCKTAKQTLENALHHTRAGQKLFVPDSKQIHIAITELQNFIVSHREEIRDPDSNNPLTFHGLRHTCAVEWYKSFLEQGYTEYQARLRVSQWLDHERDDVTRIYLASVLKGKERGIQIRFRFPKSCKISANTTGKEVNTTPTELSYFDKQSEADMVCLSCHAGSINISGQNAPRPLSASR